MADTALEYTETSKTGLFLKKYKGYQDEIDFSSHLPIQIHLLIINMSIT